MSERPAPRPRLLAGRALLALGVALAAVVGVSLLASGVRDGGGEGVRLAPSASQGAIDAVTFLLLTVGTAFTIAVFVVQFGAGREERTPASTRRRLLVVAAMVAVVVGAMPLLARVAGRIDLGDAEAPTVEPDEPGGAGAPDGALPRQVADGEGSPGGGGAVVGLVLGLVVVGGVALALQRSGGDRPPPDVPLDDDAARERERQRLAGLLDDALATLRSDPDPRRAVISAWARLEVAVAAAGRPRGASEGPRAYLGRVLEGVDASAPAVRRLGASFERAMFSPHAIGVEEQQEAVDALVAVRDELGVVASR